MDHVYHQHLKLFNLLTHLVTLTGQFRVADGGIHFTITLQKTTRSWDISHLYVFTSFFSSSQLFLTSYTWFFVFFWKLEWQVNMCDHTLEFVQAPLQTKRCYMLHADYKPATCFRVALSRSTRRKDSCKMSTKRQEPKTWNYAMRHWRKSFLQEKDGCSYTKRSCFYFKLWHFLQRVVLDVSKCLC